MRCSGVGLRRSATDSGCDAGDHADCCSCSRAYVHGYAGPSCDANADANIDAGTHAQSNAQSYTNAHSHAHGFRGVDGNADG